MMDALQMQGMSMATLILQQVNQYRKDSPQLFAQPGRIKTSQGRNSCYAEFMGSSSAPSEKDLYRAKIDPLRTSEQNLLEAT